MTKRDMRASLSVIMALLLIAGLVVAVRAADQVNRVHVVGYFANSNGIYVGDEVRILGVPVGKIDKIEPQTDTVKITFWFDADQQVPAEANAVILSPSLVSVRAIQLTPAYDGGPTMQDNAVIPEGRTAVPVEWDDFREQLRRLTETLQPTEPGGVSTLGAFVNTASDNLRGEGANIRDTLIKLSQAFSALGDHSTDLFSTIKSLSILVSALQSSTDTLRGLNQNLAGATTLLTNTPNEVGSAVANFDSVVADVTDFLAQNQENVGTASDRLASVTTALNESLGDFKETLHIAPTAFQNFVNIYEPAQGALTGALALTNFSNPLSFICGAIQAASRLGAEQSAKLCVQYLAPIVKNRHWNFPPLGLNPFVGATARPNEITYSEDWLRPDYVPPPGDVPAPPPPTPLAAEVPAPAESTDPADGLQGMMVPGGAP
ncbi:MCE family protein [Mycolicibacterium confluentis]|uniref:Mce family protein Mce3D n=1 Tax=Mycolicibacterium confluentis TaxID=28047 RepID=A0A7I7Y592_9MYCO|nr:MCE family protein [Mycolicibacterium confluentis]MCV7319176.1 MCE family protein [Mycolicibacterium confluentis]ORV24887.1 mammalian cell entry protein [Mycolicibacterium confluentis]BBZ36790.1 Mce family protein Mce3D [Mycolicibacterium confluentis]